MRLLFAGTNDIAIPALKALMREHELVGLLTQPDRPVGRHQRLTAPATKQFLLESQKEVPLICHSEQPQFKSAGPFPIFQPEQLRDPLLLEKLRTLQPEVIVTMSYGKILPSQLLNLPSLACLNIHTSLLPRHRGATPIQGAILAGDKKTGITIMHMAEGLDTGDIVLQKELLLSPYETGGSLTERLAALAPKAILEALSLLEKREALRMPQSSEGVTHTRQITRENTLIDPTQPAVLIERLIRAMNPKPGARGTFHLPSNKTISLKIFSAIAVPSPSSAPPGNLLLSHDRKLLLACQQGSLELQEIQPEGRTRMNAAAFISGHF